MPLLTDEEVGIAPQKKLLSDEEVGVGLLTDAEVGIGKPQASTPFKRPETVSTIAGGPRVKIATAAQTLSSLMDQRAIANQQAQDALGLSKETMDAMKATPGVLSELAGAEDAALRTVAGMASPEMLAVVPAAAVAPALTAGAFAVYGATQVPAAYRETKEAILHGKPGDIGKALVNDAVTTAMIAAPLAPRTVAAMRDTMSAKLPSEPAGAMTERLTAKGQSPSGVAAKPAAEAIQELRPAILTMDGGLVAGKQGQVHDDIIAENRLTPENIDRRTFVDAQGNEVQRAEAAQVTGIPTERVPGELHASELAKAQAKAPKEVAPSPETITFDSGQKSKLSEMGFYVLSPGESVPLEAPSKMRAWRFKDGTVIADETPGIHAEMVEGGIDTVLPKKLKQSEYYKKWGIEGMGGERGFIVDGKFLTNEEAAKGPPATEVKKVYHWSKTGDFETFNPGSHFGTKEAALDAKKSHQERGAGAGKMFEAEIDTSKFKRVEDQGDNPKAWESELNKAVSEGYQGLVYKNMYEGVSNAPDINVLPEGFTAIERVNEVGGKWWDVVETKDADKPFPNYFGSGKTKESAIKDSLGYFNSEAGKRRLREDSYVVASGDQVKITPPKSAGDVIGPGAQTAGQPMPPAIEQLRQAFKGLEGERVPFRTKIERAFDIGQQLSTVKDAVGRAISGLKAGGEYLIQKWQGYGELDDLLKAKGELSAATEQRGYLGMKWAKEVQRAFPDIEERKAITSWVDVGGDMAKLKQAETEVPSGRKAPYKKAQNLSPDAKLAAQQIQNHFEAKLQEAIDAGVLEDGIEDYIHRIYERAPAAAKNQALATARSGILSTNPSLARKRVFEMDFEAEKAGYLPVKDFIPRILDYETSLNRAIAARQFVAKVAGTPAKKASGGQPAVKATKGMTTADGSPMVVTAGKGIPIEDASGVRQGTLIKPASVTEEMMKNYVHRDYPALNRWKWVGEDAEGKPIMLKGDLMIHKDYVKRFDRLLKPSFVRESPVGRAALGVSSTFKQTMLDFSGFHQVQMAVHGAEHRVLPWQITKEIDFNNPNVEGLLKGGMTLGGEFHYEGEGLYGSTLSKFIPFFGKWSHDYHQYLFRDFIPRLKTTMALDALERNRKVYAKELASGKMSEDELHFLTAREANAAFGELNYTMLERSKGLQDIARLTMLAPDFLEARFRFAGQALTRHGAEQRAALFLGALVMYTTARILNKMNTGDYHFEPENMFSLVKGNKSYSLRTVQGDILHLWDNWAQFALVRLNPMTARPLFEMLGGRDEFGRKRSKLEAVWDMVSNLQPISTRSSEYKTRWESLMAGFGVNTRRYKETTDILKTVAEWKKANKIGPPGEFIYNPDADPYHKLNLALADNDDGKAVAEIKRLIDTKTKTAADMVKHFNQSAAIPITGSAANDAKFLKTLTEDQKKSFTVAQQYRKQMPILFNKALGKYYEALRNPTP